jgi:hypothetical protein
MVKAYNSLEAHKASLSGVGLDFADCFILTSTSTQPHTGAWNMGAYARGKSQEQAQGKRKQQQPTERRNSNPGTPPRLARQMPATPQSLQLHQRAGVARAAPGSTLAVMRDAPMRSSELAAEPAPAKHADAAGVKPPMRPAPPYRRIRILVGGCGVGWRRVCGWVGCVVVVKKMGV